MSADHSGGLIDDSSYDINVVALNTDGDDSGSPIYSAGRFEDLNIDQDLLRGIYHMNFKQPSKIQAKALPMLFANPPRNFIGQSQSGSGKTAAFLLNILTRIDYGLHAPQAVVLCPTRELARQINSVVCKLAQFTPLDPPALAIPGKLSRAQMIRARLVIGTPGTMMDIIRSGRLPLKDVRILVVDEADNMLDTQGLGDQCIRVKKDLQPYLSQIVLISATFPERVIEYAEFFAPRANMITLQHHELVQPKIKQLIMDCTSEEDKYRALAEMWRLVVVGSCIIFVARRVTADIIQKRLEDEGHVCLAIHSALASASDRDAIMDKIHSGRAKVLIATNVLSRGIDISNMSMVINYDLPLDRDGFPDYDTYLHRIGRTGRFGRSGISVSFVHNHESWQQLDDIQQHYKIRMTLVPTDDLETMEEIVKKTLKDQDDGLLDSMTHSRHYRAARR